MVRVSNAQGASTNLSAALIVYQGLAYSLVQDNLVLTWAGPYVLQQATNSTGPFIDVPGAQSPLTNSMSGNLERFFRLRSTLVY